VTEQGANPYKVKDQLREKLGHNAVMIEVPIGLEEKLEGVDRPGQNESHLLRRGRWAGRGGRKTSLPSSRPKRTRSAKSFWTRPPCSTTNLAEKFLEGEDLPVELLQSAIRKGVIAQELTPVFLGSAYKNKGVQPLLDGVISYLPNPTDVDNFAVDLEKDEEEVKVKVSNDEPTIALAFKLEDGQYGQLTYVRIYQGQLEQRDATSYNVRTRKKFKVGRLVRMHSNHMEDIEGAGVGDIVALFGIDCASGDTFLRP
jgi:elongation factor G